MVLWPPATVELCYANYVRDGDDEVDAGDDDRGERKLFHLVDFFGDQFALRVFAGQRVLVETRGGACRAGREFVN